MYAWGLLAYAFSAVVGGIVATALLVRHDRRQPAFVFGLFMLLMSFWAAAGVGVLASKTLEWRLVFFQFSYISVATVPVVWLLFGLLYTGRGEWLSRKRIALLSGIPAITLLLVFTAQWHSLFYADITLVQGANGPVLQTPPGPWHTVNIVYSYALLVVGTGLIAGVAVTSNRLYRRQSVVLLACALIPWLVNGLYLFGIHLLFDADPTPVAFILAGIPLAGVVQRTELTRFAPIAHEQIFSTLSDPVLVLGPDHTVIDSNRAARALFDGDDTTIDSAHVAGVLPAVLVENGELHPDLETTRECVIDHDGERRQYVARRRDINPQFERHSRGSLLSLTDVTHQKEQQTVLEERNTALTTKTEQLEIKNEQLERLASIVSHDLTTPLATGESLLHLLRADIDGHDPELEQSLSDLEAVHERLQEFAEALPELARESTDVESPADCDLATIVQAAWNVVDTGELRLSIESTLSLQADPRRLQQVFENIFQNVVDHASTSCAASKSEDIIENDSISMSTGSQASQGGEDSTRVASSIDRPFADNFPGKTDEVDNEMNAVLPDDEGATTVTVGAFEPANENDHCRDQTGFYVEDNGPGIPSEHREQALKFGVSTGSGSGYGLAIVRTIIEAHGWSFHITDSNNGGARFEVGTAE
jgi:signal transduction histidine kinase